ncbi:MAG: hypothetical protein CVU97_00035 [Firmicutes bacterium HGW-Firmicutes-21]|nr:MAG: hypothetical protein CVU97_00035 [Firmicutes bacterium HGW-Firmicutes-21]
MEQRDKAALAYKKARNNLLVMTILTVVNMVLMLTNLSINFSFSASTPQIVLAFSIFVFENLLGGIIISVIIIGLFLLCWHMSKKNNGWLIAALVLFSIDTLILLLFALDIADTSFLFEIAFHAWVLYYLITGVKAGAKLKNITEADGFGMMDMSGDDGEA